MIIPVSGSMKRYSNIQFSIKRDISKIFRKRSLDVYQIPIIINNFNRLQSLQLLLRTLETAGYKNIYILDNNSSYKPLLKFYKSTRNTVYALDRNCGHFALWKTIVFSKFNSDYYVYTDPDIIPSDEGITDLLNYFKFLLTKYKNVYKVGCALRIDDLPDHYSKKNLVIKWENKFWQNKVEDDLYLAPIDTTFALYAPGIAGGANIPALRVAGKYSAHHLPWYENSECLSEETKYYLQTANDSSSWYDT